jgi:hypothetical protein
LYLCAQTVATTVLVDAFMSRYLKQLPALGDHK